MSDLDVRYSVLSSTVGSLCNGDEITNNKHDNNVSVNSSYRKEAEKTKKQNRNRNHYFDANALLTVCWDLYCIYTIIYKMS